jgi:hypothetical protein
MLTCTTAQVAASGAQPNHQRGMLRLPPSDPTVAARIAADRARQALPARDLGALSAGPRGGQPALAHPADQRLGTEDYRYIPTHGNAEQGGQAASVAGGQSVWQQALRAFFEQLRGAPSFVIAYGDHR